VAVADGVAVAGGVAVADGVDVGDGVADRAAFVAAGAAFADRAAVVADAVAASDGVAVADGVAEGIVVADGVVVRGTAIAVAFVAVPRGCTAMVPLSAPNPSTAATVVPFLSRLKRRSASALASWGGLRPPVPAVRVVCCGVSPMACVLLSCVCHRSVLPSVVFCVRLSVYRVLWSGGCII
jgi:hypothetical protein